MLTKIAKSLLFVPVLIVLVAGSARADSIVDPVGDFAPTYAGPRGGDLDVVSTSVSLIGTNFVFSATMNGAVGTTAQAFYIWGVDRGTGAATASFTQLGLPNIIFDAVIRINPNGTGLVNLLAPGPPASTALPTENITISGNTFQAIVPLSFLPSRGFTPERYGQNLWPRWGGATGDAQISDFAPDDRNAGVTVIPEPATVLLLGTGLAGIGAAAARRRRRAARRS